MKRSLVGACVTVIVCSTVLLAQQPAKELLIGTWRQNVEKSTYSPGPPPTKGSFSVRQYATGDDGSIISVTMTVDSRGLPSVGQLNVANYDGKEYTQHTIATLATSLSSHVGPRVIRTVSYKLLDPYTVEIVQKQDGKVVSTHTRTISRDGKTLTEVYSSPDNKNVLAFERQ
jgi:hypothetical protein